MRKRTFGHVRCEDSSQSVHSHSLIRIALGALGIAKDTNFFHANHKDSDQTARIRKLI